MSMMCPHKFVNCKKYITLVRNVDNGRGYACTGARGIWEIYVFSSQVCSAPKTVLKNKVLKK